MGNQIRDTRRIVVSGGTGVPASLISDITTLKNNVYKVIYFAQVSSGTSGTITIPSGATIILGELPGNIDVLTSTLSGGFPTDTSPITAGSVVVTATLDASGNYTLSGTPSAYPIALIYVLTIKAIDYNSLTTGNIIEYYQVTNNLGTVISVSGTTNRITVTSPTTTPIIDISSSYVGQSSITTLGTITTGTWTGSIISGRYGGTGVNNSGNTITISGNLVTTGAFNTTFATGFTGTITLPTATSTLYSTQSGSITSAQLATSLTDESGTGVVVFNTSPTLVTPVLGTPTSGIATNLTGLPLTTGVTGILPIANGGTNSNSQSSTGINYFDGTKITSSANFNYDGSSTVQIKGSTLAALQFIPSSSSGNVQFTLFDEAGTAFTGFGNCIYGASNYGSSNQIFGFNRTEKFFLFSGGANNTGMVVGTIVAQPLIFGTNNVEISRFLSGGQLLVGYTSLIGTETIGFQKDQNTISSITMKNASTGTAASIQTRYYNSSVQASTGLNSTGYTPYGALTASCFYHYTSNAAGIALMVDANGPITFSTGTAAPASERIRVLGTGELLIGSTAQSGSEVLLVRRDQNAATYNTTVNATSGTAASAGFFCSPSASLSTYAGVRCYSAGFTSSGIDVANTAVLETNQSAGMNIGTFSNTQLSFWTNNIQRWTIDNSGQLSGNTSGKGISIKSGSNCKIGTGTLIGGTVTITNTSVTASSVIFITDTTSGSLANVGNLTCPTASIIAGTSFVVNSTNVLDTSTFNYIIFETN